MIVIRSSEMADDEVIDLAGSDDEVALTEEDRASLANFGLPSTQQTDSDYAYISARVPAGNADSLYALLLQQKELERAEADAEARQAARATRPTSSPTTAGALSSTLQAALIAEHHSRLSSSSPFVDVHSLFLLYSTLFFHDSLPSVSVRWSSRMTLCAGLCRFDVRGGGCDIALSESLLRYRSKREVIETLLHEMIHAYLFVGDPTQRDHEAHGANFCSHMKRINELLGLKLTVYHTFHAEVKQFKRHVWQCLAEHDTRLLTDKGFLFLSDIEKRIAANEEVRYACYETSTHSIVYSTGTLIVDIPPPAQWVDFTHAGTRRQWDITSDDYGAKVSVSGVPANYLTLRATPDHDMYVQLCTQSEEMHHSRCAGGASNPPHKMRAEELAPGYQCECNGAGRTCTHGYSHYRMYTGAASGLHMPADSISPEDCDSHSPVVALGLQSKDELDAFLELFGYWLSDGTMSHNTNATRTSHDAVIFRPSKNCDRVYLRSLLARLRLKPGQHFTSNESEVRLEVRITEPRWFRFFDDEFGVAYINSRHYDSRRPLLKHDMHNTQRRLSTSSTSSSVSASATASVSVASSTRVRSLSASVSVELGADYNSDDDDEADAVEEQDDSAASVRWLPDWSLFRLNAEQLRLVIEGLRHAAGTSAATAAQRQSAPTGGEAMQGEQHICTFSVGFRDQLIQACLHAGYSAYFTLSTAAGAVRGYNPVPNDQCIYTAEEMEALLRIDSTRQFKPVRSKHDSWRVCYSEVISELLPAQDVRFDGRARRVQHEKKCEDHRSSQAIWQQEQAASIATQPGDLYDQERDGRVWCVDVDHDDHLIFVQRAHCNANGVVTKVGRAMVVGNCQGKCKDWKP